jgi:hypothetical protein
MHFTNELLLSVTFLASILLLATMQRRRLIRRLFLFFALLVFYVLRSAVLIFGVKVFDRAAYIQVASLMSLVDLGLQLALAYALIRSFTGPRPTVRGPATPRLQDSALFLFAVALLVAGGLTLGLVSALPIYSPVPVDRGVVFCGLVFLLLLFVRYRRANVPEARLLIGFCIVSAANILAQFGKTIAAAQNDPRVFLAWAYGNIAVWICVLVFWIFRLQPGQVHRREQKAERPRPLVRRRVPQSRS